MMSQHPNNLRQDRSDLINRIIWDLQTNDLENHVGSLRRQLSTEMQSVYSIGSIYDYSLGYKQRQMIDAIKSLESTYSIWLGIRGDGNCFYRSVIILYLLHLSQQQGVENLENFIIRIHNLNEIESQNEVNMTNKSKIIKQIFLVYLLELRNMKINRQEINLMNIVNEYNTLPELDFSAVVITRYLIYQAFQNNKDHSSIQMFIEDDMGKQIPRLLLRYSEYAEDIIIPLTAQTFEIHLVVQNLYSSSEGGPINTDKLHYLPFSEANDKAYPEIHVLFTRGHYEALISNQTLLEQPNFYDYFVQGIPSFLQQECHYSEIVNDLYQELLNENKYLYENSDMKGLFQNSINSSQSTNYTEINHITSQLNKMLGDIKPINEDDSTLRVKKSMVDERNIQKSSQNNTGLVDDLKNQKKEKEQTKANEKILQEDKNLLNEKKDGSNNTNKEVVQQQQQDEKNNNSKESSQYQKNAGQADDLKNQTKEEDYTKANDKILQEDQNLLSEKKDGFDNTNKEVVQQQQQDEKINNSKENAQQIENIQLDITKKSLKENSQLVEDIKEEQKKQKESEQSQIEIKKIVQNDEVLKHSSGKKDEEKKEEPKDGQNVEQSQNEQQCYKCKENSNQFILVFQTRRKKSSVPICVSCLQQNLDRFYFNDNDESYFVYGNGSSIFYLDNQNSQKLKQIISEKFKYLLENHRYSILRYPTSSHQNVQSNEDIQQCFECKQKTDQSILIFESNQRNKKYVCVPCLEKNLKILYTDSKYIVYGDYTTYYLDEFNLRKIKQIIEKQFKYELQNSRYSIVRQEKTQAEQQNQISIAQQCFDCKQSLEQKYIFISESRIQINAKCVCISCLEKNLKTFKSNLKYIIYGQDTIYYLDYINTTNLKQIVEQQFKFNISNETYQIIRQNNNQDQQQNSNLNQLFNQQSQNKTMTLQCCQCNQASKQFIQCYDSLTSKNVKTLCMSCLENNLDKFNQNRSQISLTSHQIFYLDEYNCQTLLSLIKSKFQYEEKLGTYQILRNNVSFKQDLEQVCFKCEKSSQEYILVSKERQGKELLALCIPCLKNNIIEYYTLLNQLICKQDLRLFVKDSQTSQKLQMFIKLNLKYENKDYNLRIQSDSTNNQNLNLKNQDQKATQNINQVKINGYMNSPLKERFEESKNASTDKIGQLDQKFSTPKKENKISQNLNSPNQLSQYKTSSLAKEFEQNNYTEISKSHVKKECLYCHQDIQQQNSELIFSRQDHGYLCQQCVNDIVESGTKDQKYVLINNQLYEYSDKMKNQIKILQQNKQQQSKLSMSNEKKNQLLPNSNSGNKYFQEQINQVNQNPKTDSEEKKSQNENLSNFQNKYDYEPLFKTKCQSDYCNKIPYSEIYLVAGQNGEEILQTYCEDCLIAKFLLVFEKGQTMVCLDDMIYRLDKQSKFILESEKDRQMKLLQNIEMRNEYRDLEICIICKRNLASFGSFFCTVCNQPSRSQSHNQSSLMKEQNLSQGISQNNQLLNQYLNDKEIQTTQKYAIINDIQSNQDRKSSTSYQSPLKDHHKTNSIDDKTNQNLNLHNIQRRQIVESEQSAHQQKYKIVNESLISQKQDKNHCKQCNKILYKETLNQLCSMCDYYINKSQQQQEFNFNYK
ncbi:hypothetical protein ABPG74_009928 [Tetrahymena malaccensis]